ncbi:MAG: LamG domain-containing protein, partial [Flavobacteriales bacterium]
MTNFVLELTTPTIAMELRYTTFLPTGLLPLLLLLTTTITAQTHNALDFDGVNDRVVCGTDALVDITGTHITVEAWINPGFWGPNNWSGNIVNKEDAAWSGFMLRCGASGQLNFAIGDGVDWYETTSPANVLTLNTWQHVAATYDGAFVRLYVNGVQVASLVNTIPIAHADNPLVLGDWSVNATHRYYQGIMDEVRIWNITLDAATIAANVNTSFCDAQPGLVAYFKFDQGVGGGDNTSITTLIEETGINPGALAGFELTGNTSNFVGGTILGTQVSGVICPDESYLFDGQELTEPGTYTATFPTDGSCDSTVVLTLTEPTVNTNVVQNANTLIATATGTYQWIDCNNNAPIPGATGQYYMATANGDYAVIVTQSGCADTSLCHNITGIGMAEIAGASFRVQGDVVHDGLWVEVVGPATHLNAEV